jgi:hypothetical protein
MIFYYFQTYLLLHYQPILPVLLPELLLSLHHSSLPLLDALSMTLVVVERQGQEEEEVEGHPSHLALSYYHR